MPSAVRPEVGLKRWGIERLGRWLWPTLVGPFPGAGLLALARSTQGIGGGWSFVRLAGSPDVGTGGFG